VLAGWFEDTANTIRGEPASGPQTASFVRAGSGVTRNVEVGSAPFKNDGEDHPPDAASATLTSSPRT
jgi:hypothetical protein